MNGFNSPRDILRAPLVHDGDRTRWESWFAQIGVNVNDTPLPGQLSEDELLATNAVLHGLGVDLLRTALVQQELRQGSLVQLSGAELSTGQDYYLYLREDAQLPDAVQRLAQWLLRSTQPAGSHA